MKTIPVLCNSCGAKLKVDEHTRFATCRFCDSTLAVKHTDSTVFTEVVEEVRQTTAKIKDDVEVLKIQSELERLDREWLMEREKYASHDDKGRVSYPDSEKSPSAMIGAVVFMALWFGALVFMLVAASRSGAPAFFPVMIGAMIVLGILTMVTKIGPEGEYEDAKIEFEAERRKLLNELKQAEET